MLNPAVVDEIRRLLALGAVSQRQIARQLRVSRGTVLAIASGKRRPCGKNADPEELFTGPIGRCPECGARVYLPCLACRVRRSRWAG